MPRNPDDFERKAREVRRVYRQAGGDYAAAKAEFDRLFAGEKVQLPPILRRAWIEARELAGWRWNQADMAWYRADGSKVVDDDGSEWRHL